LIFSPWIDLAFGRIWTDLFLEDKTLLQRDSLAKGSGFSQQPHPARGREVLYQVSK
jgi:hypothetical protein